MVRARKKTSDESVSMPLSIPFLVYAFLCPEGDPSTTPKIDALCVARLWADPRGGSITAHLGGTERDPHLDGGRRQQCGHVD